MNKVFSITGVTLIGVFLTLAAGCVNLGPGTTSSTRLYVLVPLVANDTGQDQVRPQLAAVGVGPTDFPEYLNRPQLVTRVGDDEIQTADFANWAEPLHRNFQRVLAENLSLLLSTEAVYTHPWRSSLRPAYRLEVAVLRFDANPRGDAVLVVAWEILDAHSRQVSPRKKGVFRRAVGGGDDPAVVRAMSQVLVDFSRKAADELAALPQAF